MQSVKPLYQFIGIQAKTCLPVSGFQRVRRQEPGRSGQILLLVQEADILKPTNFLT